MTKAKLLFLGLALALVAGVTAIYGRVGSYEYLSYDDEGYTVDCPFVRDGLTPANAVAAFKDPAWGGIYMPITYMTYAAVISACGTSPGPQHTLNAILHAADTLLFFLFLLVLFHSPNHQPKTNKPINQLPNYSITQLTNKPITQLPNYPINQLTNKPITQLPNYPINQLTNKPINQLTILLAFLATALWSWHALRVESVAWVASRKDLLFTMFTLLGLMAWIRMSGAKRVLCATVLMLLGCLSKPTAMVFPALAFALETWGFYHRHPEKHTVLRPPTAVIARSPSPGAGRRGNLCGLLRELSAYKPMILPYLPLAVLSVATAALAAYSQTHGTGEDAHELFMATFSWRCLNAAVSLGLYIWHFFVPVGLQFWYRPIRDGIPLNMQLGLSVFAVTLIAYALALWRCRSLRRPLLLSGFWFAAAIFPTLGVAGSFGNHAFADRFTYVPMMSVSIFLLYFFTSPTTPLRRHCEEPDAPASGDVAISNGLSLNKPANQPIIGQPPMTNDQPPTTNQLTNKPINQLTKFLILPIIAFILTTPFFAARYCRTYETNLTAFENVARLDPGHCYAWKEIGSQIIMRTGDMDKGIEYLRKSLALFPEDDAREELAMALAMRNNPKDEAEIIDLCMRDAGPITDNGVIPLLPKEKDKNGFKLEALGVIATRHHDWPNAIRCFSEAWARGGREDCRMRLALCHWNVKDRAAAIPHLRALALSPRPDVSAKARELLSVK